MTLYGVLKGFNQAFNDEKKKGKTHLNIVCPVTSMFLGLLCATGSHKLQGDIRTSVCIVFENIHHYVDCKYVFYFFHDLGLKLCNLLNCPTKAFTEHVRIAWSL